MQPNPLLKKLGYKDDDRVMIVHVDDVGDVSIRYRSICGII